MANITHYDPFGELARFDPLADLDDLLRAPRLRAAWRNLPQEPQIRMDVTEDDGAYHVKAEIPGVDKENVKVSIDGNVVSVRAEVRRESEQKHNGEKTIRSERYYGMQSRVFSLDRDIDQTKAEAKYEKGLLLLTLPKKQGSTTRELAVQ